MQKWYSRFDVLFNIRKFTYKREVAFLIPSYESKEMKKRSIRMLRVHSTQHLNYIFDALNVFKRQTPYNLYVSLAEFVNGIPYQDLSNNMKNRDNHVFYNNYDKEISYYDLLIDVDSKEHDFIYYARNTVLELLKLFCFCCFLTNRQSNLENSILILISRIAKLSIFSVMFNPFFSALLHSTLNSSSLHRKPILFSLTMKNHHKTIFLKK